MEVNEAPEKIYLIRNYSSPTALNTTNDPHGKFLDWWCTSREKDVDVEYVRTDAFIEKACDFLKDHLAGYDICEDDIERSIESFKLAMKL